MKIPSHGQLLKDLNVVNHVELTLVDRIDPLFLIFAHIATFKLVKKAASTLRALF